MSAHPAALLALLAAAVCGCDNENDLGSGTSRGHDDRPDAGLEASVPPPGVGGGGAVASAGGSSNAGGHSAGGVSSSPDAAAGGSRDPGDGRAPDGGHGGNVPCAYTFPDVPAPICGAAVCGNGLLDSCMTLCTSLGPCPVLHEDCDPSVPAGASCEALGYSGGRIACTPWCAFDETGCLACAAPGGPLLSCERPCVDSANAGSITVAVTTGVIGVAWTTWCSTCSAPNRLHFAGFDENLHVLFESTSPGGATYAQIALARSSKQWLLAATDDSGVTIYGFDDQGRALGTHSIPKGRDPAFGMQPGGAPLLLWTAPSSNPSENGVRQAAMSTDDGQLATAAVSLWPSPEGRAGVLFVGDGFLVAQCGGTAIHTARLALSGALLSSAPMPLGDTTEAPTLVPIEQDVGVMYFDYAMAGVVKWAVLDKTGNVVSAPVTLSPQPRSYNPEVYDVISSGAGVLLLTPSTGPHYELGVSGVDSQGRLSSSPFVVAKSGKGFREPVLTRFGANAVAAWIEGPVTADPSAVATLYLGMLSLK